MATIVSAARPWHSFALQRAAANKSCTVDLQCSKANGLQTSSVGHIDVGNLVAAAEHSTVRKVTATHVLLQCTACTADGLQVQGCHQSVARPTLCVLGRTGCVGKQSATLTSIRCSRVEMVNSELGMVPVNELTDSSTSFSWLKLPSAAGRVPLMLLPADQAGQVLATGCHDAALHGVLKQL